MTFLFPIRLRPRCGSVSYPGLPQPRLQVSLNVVLIVSSSDQLVIRSNTESLEHPETHHIEIYAREEIPAGTQLTTSYVSSCLERDQRRQQLQDIWNFWCRCETCRDNTERGTFRQTSPPSKLTKKNQAFVFPKYV